MGWFTNPETPLSRHDCRRRAGAEIGLMSMSSLPLVLFSCYVAEAVVSPQWGKGCATQPATPTDTSHLSVFLSRKETLVEENGVCFGTK